MTNMFCTFSAVCALGLMVTAIATPASAEDSNSATISRQKIPAKGEKAPDFALNTPDGSPISLSKLTAKSPVVLIVLRGFPGYQCPLCAMQVSNLIAHTKELEAAKAQVLLVYPGPGEGLDSKANEFLKMKGFRGAKLPEQFSYVTDPDYKFTLAYGLRWDAPRETAYPSTFVIDQDGIIRYAKISKTHGDRAPLGDILKALAESP